MFSKTHLQHSYNQILWLGDIHNIDSDYTELSRIRTTPYSLFEDLTKDYGWSICEVFIIIFTSKNTTQKVCLFKTHLVVHY
jgi:hypothetical protein